MEKKLKISKKNISTYILETMKQLFRDHWIEITNKQEESFKRFLALFIEKNSQVNLSAIRDEDGIILKHFIDSLMVTKYTKMFWSIADVGTGWWFPWIPLKIFYGDALDVTFIDSIGKKVKAVEDFCKGLECKNFTCIHSRSEDLGNKHKAAYNFVVSRAVAYFEDLLHYTLPLVKKGWYFIAYKLDNPDEIQKAEKTLKKFNAFVERIESYELEWQKRVLVFVKKD